MYLMAVDDERVALERLLVMLEEVHPLAEIKGFLNYVTAFAEIENGFRPKVAFLDIELGGMNGIVLAQRLQKAIPDINLIFISSSTRLSLYVRCLCPACQWIPYKASVRGTTS